MRSIFEDRFLFEDGVYWTYTTDEKRNIDRKDEQRLPSYFLRITYIQYSFREFFRHLAPVQFKIETNDLQKFLHDAGNRCHRCDCQKRLLRQPGQRFINILSRHAVRRSRRGKLTRQQNEEIYTFYVYACRSGFLRQGSHSVG